MLFDIQLIFLDDWNNFKEWFGGLKEFDEKFVNCMSGKDDLKKDDVKKKDFEKKCDEVGFEFCLWVFY